MIESAELTVMTLLTAIANTAEPDNRAKMSEIILRLLNTVDNGKLLAMADKAMLWMAVSAEKVKIRICGSYLFLLILQTDGNKFHLANFMNRYVIGANRLLSILTVNLD